MTAVPAGQELCAKAKKSGAYCYDWQLTADPTIHIVSVGYEDGGSVDIYQVDGSGTYEHISKVFPVLREKGDRDSLYFAYSWDITDVAVSADDSGVQFFGAFRHDFVDDGEGADFTRKTPIPIVLFLGKNSQPDGGRARVPLRKLSLAEMKANEHG